MAPYLKDELFGDYMLFVTSKSYREEAASLLKKTQYAQASTTARKASPLLLQIESKHPYSPLIKEVPEELGLTELVIAVAERQRKKWSAAEGLFHAAFQRLSNQNSLYLLTPEYLKAYADVCNQSSDSERGSTSKKSKNTKKKASAKVAAAPRSELCQPWIIRLVSQFPKSSEEYKTLDEAFPSIVSLGRPNYMTEKRTTTYSSPEADTAAFDAAMAQYLDGKTDDALKSFQLLLDNYPRSAHRYRASFWIGKSYLKEKEPEKAKKVFTDLMKDSPLTFYGLAAALSSDQSIEKLFDTKLPDAVSRDNYAIPQEAVRLKRAEKLIVEGVHEFAIQELKEIKARDTAPSPYLFYLASLNSEAQNHGGAFGLLSELIHRKFDGIYSTYGLRLVFPVVYLDLIKKNAQAIDLDPVLALSLMKQESAFEAAVHSRSGASGLMQLMPFTAVETEPTVKRADLLDPDTNIRVGTKYLKKMLVRYNGNISLALAAYNAGPGAVDRWIRDGRTKAGGPLEFIEQIPYRETREYVGTIIRNYFWYSHLLRGDSFKRLEQFWGVYGPSPKSAATISAPSPDPLIGPPPLSNGPPPLSKPIIKPSPSPAASTSSPASTDTASGTSSSEVVGPQPAQPSVSE